MVAKQVDPDITFRAGFEDRDIGVLRNQVHVVYWCDPGNVVLAGWLRHTYGGERINTIHPDSRNEETLGEFVEAVLGALTFPGMGKYA